MFVMTDKMTAWGLTLVVAAGVAIGAGGCASTASTSHSLDHCVDCVKGSATSGQSPDAAGSPVAPQDSPTGTAASPSGGCVDVCPPPNPPAKTGHVTLPLPAPKTTPGAVATTPQLGTVTVVHEVDNGKTVHVPVGGVLNLVDFSSFWSLPQASDPSVLATSATQDTWRLACGTGLHAELGCVIPSTPYRAVKAGTVRLTASRTQCGEAMPCRPPNSYSFAVTVVVG